MANDTEFGLVAYVFTRDLGARDPREERLETGMVGLNQGVVSNPARRSAASSSGLRPRGRHRGHRGVPRDQVRRDERRRRACHAVARP